MSLAEFLLLNLGVVATAMLALWLISLRLRDASIADIFWGIGFVVIAWLSVVLPPAASPRSVLVAVLTTAWGLRLGGYLAWRNVGKGEDARYRAMRDKWGGRFPFVSLFSVFLLQGLIMWLVAFPIQAAGFGLAPLGWLDLLGLGLWAVGWFFESVGDLQLARFKANPANSGRVMDRGLWRYTRHPNYFGDFMVWWGLYCIAVAGGAAWTVFSPLVMSVLLMRVSGVTLLERSLRDRRAGYDAYVARTSEFFPRPPKR